MEDKQIAEVLYLINRIEELMVKDGARGESFSDKVKSFDDFEELYPDIDRSAIGYKFYYKDGTFHIKDQYDYESGIHGELREYIEFKTYRKRRYAYREKLLRGQYHTLRIIGHERNQLMHIYNYKISNYKKFIKACNEIITYFESAGEDYSWNPTQLNKAEDKLYPLSYKSEVKPYMFASESGTFKMLAGLTTLLFVIHFIFYGLYAKKAVGEDLLTQETIAFTIDKNASNDELQEQLSKVLYSNKVKMKTIKEYKSTVDVLQNENYDLKKKLKAEKLRYAQNITQRSTAVKTTKSTVNNTMRTNEKCTYFYVKPKTLNVRKEPNKYSKKVHTLKRNDKLCVISKKSSWSYIKDKGWVNSNYLTKYAPSKKKKKAVTKKKDRSVWHCSAKSDRASGWVERVGKQNAMNGAIRQCNIRKVTNSICKINNCYKIR